MIETPAALDPALDKPLITPETRHGFHVLARAIHASDTNRELVLYVERHHRAMADIRAIADMIDSEIAVRLRHFGGIEGAVSHPAAVLARLPQ